MESGKRGIDLQMILTADEALEQAPEPAYHEAPEPAYREEPEPAYREAPT